VFALNNSCKTTARLPLFFDYSLELFSFVANPIDHLLLTIRVFTTKNIKVDMWNTGTYIRGRVLCLNPTTHHKLVVLASY